MNGIALRVKAKCLVLYPQYIATCLPCSRQLANVCGNDRDGDLKAYSITCLYNLCLSYSVFYFNLRYMHVHRDVTLWRRKNSVDNCYLGEKTSLFMRGLIFNDFKRNLWVKHKCDHLRTAMHFWKMSLLISMHSHHTSFLLLLYQITTSSGVNNTYLLSYSLWVRSPT